MPWVFKTNAILPCIHDFPAETYTIYTIVYVQKGKGLARPEKSHSPAFVCFFWRDLRDAISYFPSYLFPHFPLLLICPFDF